uniref:AMP-dependent synthetase/ligase domain-containing protein n=1 Tax=Parascaris equorum TaxID=6256 RepID=A0A914RV84_PAREQ
VVPAIIGYLCQNDEQFSRWNISSVTTVLCGSAPLGKELSQRFLKKFAHITNLIQGYGMTEVVVLSHITPLGISTDDAKHLGSCGKLLPGFEAKVRHQKSFLCMIASKIVFSNLAVDNDGWLHTGFYYVVDRLKDLIKVNGLQVAPAELVSYQRLFTLINIIFASVKILITTIGFFNVRLIFILYKKIEHTSKSKKL